MGNWKIFWLTPRVCAIVHAYKKCLYEKHLFVKSRGRRSFKLRATWSELPDESFLPRIQRIWNDVISRNLLVFETEVMQWNEIVFEHLIDNCIELHQSCLTLSNPAMMGYFTKSSRDTSLNAYPTWSAASKLSYESLNQASN